MPYGSQDMKPTVMSGSPALSNPGLMLQMLNAFPPFYIGTASFRQGKVWSC